MARYLCHDCGAEETVAYTGDHECPVCASDNVQFALTIDEIDDDHPLIAALREMADDEDVQD